MFGNSELGLRNGNRESDRVKMRREAAKDKNKIIAQDTRAWSIVLVKDMGKNSISVL